MIGHRLRRYCIDWTMEGFGDQGVVHRPEDVVQGNPTHILLARAHDPAETEPKGGEHLGERSSCRTQHYAKAQTHDAYTALHGGRCG